MKNTQTLLAITTVCVVQTLCSVAWAASTGRILVANRTSGTLSIIDERTDKLVKNVSVAGKFARPPEPMYVNYSAKYNRILVNDRANNQIIAMNADTYEIQNTVPQGGGAFHMWTDGLGKQTWSVNDVDKTFTVINPGNLKILKTLSIPADLASKGGKPHDILLDKKAKWAFTTIVGVEGDNDYVVQYNTSNFKEMARFATGKDPHVGLLNNDTKLFVPTQVANKVYILDPNKKLKQFGKGLDIPTAHGVTWTPDNQFVYVTNVAGEALKGSKNHNGLWAINTKTMKIVGSSAIPKLKKLASHTHNVTVNAAGTKLYLTHSGHEVGTVEGDVTVWNISSKKPVPVYAKKRIHVGLNPFGIAYIPGR